MKYIKTYEANLFSNLFKGKNANIKPDNKWDNIKGMKIDLRELKSEKFDSIEVNDGNHQIGYVNINNSEKNKIKSVLNVDDIKIQIIARNARQEDYYQLSRSEKFVSITFNVFFTLNGDKWMKFSGDYDENPRIYEEDGHWFLMLREILTQTDGDIVGLIDVTIGRMSDNSATLNRIKNILDVSKGNYIKEEKVKQFQSNIGEFKECLLDIVDISHKHNIFPNQAGGVTCYFEIDGLKTQNTIDRGKSTVMNKNSIIILDTLLEAKGRLIDICPDIEISFEFKNSVFILYLNDKTHKQSYYDEY